MYIYIVDTIIFVTFAHNYLPSIRHIAIAFSKVWIYGKSLLVFCNAHVIITNLQQKRNPNTVDNVR